MNQDQLETTLRATLAGRAETVTHGPDWAPPAELTARRRPRHVVRWLAPLAAAAAVAAVVGSVVAIEHESSGRHVRPGTHQPTDTRTSARPSLQVPPPPPAPFACPATLPHAWRQAVHDSLIDVGGTTAMPLSVAPDGGILVARDFGPIPGSARDVVLVERGRGPQVVYRVADPDAFAAAQAEQVGHWLIVGLGAGARPPRGSVPGSTSLGLRRIVVVDLDRGAQRTIASTPPNGLQRSITTMAVLDGKVYWDSEPHYGAANGTVYRYDLATGGRTVAYHGPIGYPATSAAGFGWGGPDGYRIHIAVPIPGLVAQATDAASRTTLGTDGTAWAWAAGLHRIGWWSTGQPVPTYVRIHGPALTGAGRFPAPMAVSGRFVFPDNGTDQVVDIRAQATAALPAYRPHVRGSLALSAGPSGVVAGEVEFGAAGHFVQGYWQDTPIHVLRLDTTRLPGLSC